MALEWDKDRLMELLRSFHAIAHVRIGIFQADGREGLAYPGEICDFCRILKTDERFACQCDQEDAAAFAAAREKGGVHIYRCHAGLYEATAPIYCGQTVEAFIMIGQAAPVQTPPVSLPRGLAEHAHAGALLASFTAMPTYSEEYLADCARIMAACAGYIYQNGWILQAQSSLSARLQAYIEANHTRPISLTDMATYLNVSMTRLCTQIRQETGSTPHALLTSFRMEKAAALLRQTDLSVQAIAAAVGLPDYNYFSRVFRREKQMSPSQYRKRLT